MFGVGILAFMGVVNGGIWVHQGTTEKHEPRKVAEIDVLLNGTTLNEIKIGEKEDRYSGNSVFLTDESGETTEFNEVELKLRGNSTLMQEKKPFQLKFAIKTNVLGLGEAKKWVLRNNFLDRSYLRDDAAMKIAEMIGEDYAWRGKFVEMYFGGEYEGLYYLLHKVEIGKGRVDLRDTAGVLVEMDSLHKDEGGCYFTYAGSCLKLIDVVLEEEGREEEVMGEFLTDFNKLEMAAEKGDYAGVTELADVESLAKYFLISDFSANPDAYASSFYFYRDGAGDKIHAGPVWDFDFAFGNKEWWWGEEIEGFFNTDNDQVRREEAFSENSNGNIAKLFYQLMDMPEFRAEVARVWQERMSGRGQELMLSLKKTASTIREAALRDAEKWNRGDFDAEVEYLLNWIEARYVHMEEVYGGEEKTAPLMAV